MPARAAYNRFDVSGGRDGHRGGEALPRDVLPRRRALAGGRARADRRAGTRLRQAAGDRAHDRSETVYVPACGVRTIPLPTPDGPWRVEVAIDTFVPAEIDPKGSGSERRALGARVVVRRRPALAPHRGDEIGEARAQREPCEPAQVRSATFSRPTAGPGSRRVCGTKNGRSSTRAKPASAELGDDVLDPVLARVEVEDELLAP